MVNLPLQKEDIRSIPPESSRQYPGVLLVEFKAGEKDAMRKYCPVLRFPIEKETVCRASGSHPLCQRCQKLAGGGAIPAGPEEGNGRASLEIPPMQAAARTKRRQRCECGRAFFMNGNRHIYCPRCQKKEYRKKAREWDQKNRKRKSEIRELGALG